MKIETEYEIGDYIEYHKISETVGGKKSSKKMIGEIESISIKKSGLIYWLTDGYYRGGVPAENIIGRLRSKADWRGFDDEQGVMHTSSKSADGNSNTKAN